MPDDPQTTQSGQPGQGQPPAQPGQPQTPPGQPAGQPAAPPAAPPAKPTVLDHPDLPEEIRGKSPKEFKELWDLQRQALSAAAYARQMYDESQQRPEPPAAPAEPPLNLKELIMEDPEAAIRAVTERTYGPLIADLASKAVEGSYSAVRNRLPDFGKYEGEVRKEIDRLKVPAQALQPNHIELAYYVVRGRKVEETEKAAAATAIHTQTEQPRPGPTPTAPPQLSDIEMEIARRQNFLKEDRTVDVAQYIHWRDGSGGNTFYAPVHTEEKGYGKPQPKPAGGN